METEERNGTDTHVEVAEKPVREQLGRASISKASGDGKMADDETVSIPSPSQDTGETAEADESRGRLEKKRSFEDLQAEDQQDEAAQPSRQHTRKRSRDSTNEEHELNNGQRKSSERVREGSDVERDASSNGHPKVPIERPRTPEQTREKRGEAAVEEMTSPKSKRSRLQSDNEENGTHATESTAAETITDVEPTEPAVAAKTDVAAPSTRGFTNTSATSPFASLSGSKSRSADRPTSPSAFAASGFSSLTGSTSGFGAIGKDSGGFGAGGGFASGTKSPIAGGEKGPTSKETENLRPLSASPFGGVLGQQSAFVSAGSSGGSAFGTGASGFGKLSGSSAFGGTFASGGFGSLSGGGGLSSFASGKPSSAPLGSSKPVKAFGAAADEEEGGDEEGEEGDDSGIRSPLSQESDKQDERFFEQSLETGEEDEMTEYSCRAKLYNFVSGVDGKKEWKERGLGVVRLNVRKPAADEDATKPKAPRLLMRAEGSHRVILNTPVKKEIKFGTPTGGPPEGGYVYFMGTVDGKASLELLQLKVRQQFATELHEKVTALQQAM